MDNVDEYPIISIIQSANLLTLYRRLRYFLRWVAHVTVAMEPVVNQAQKQAAVPDKWKQYWMMYRNQDSLDTSVSFNAIILFATWFWIFFFMPV